MDNPTQLESDMMKFVHSGINEAIKSALTSYNSPLEKFANSVIASHETAIKKIMSDGVAELIASDEFRQSILNAIRGKFAGVIIAKMGGELEKQINKLKSHPDTRAKIQLALSKLADDILEPATA